MGHLQRKLARKWPCWRRPCAILGHAPEGHIGTHSLAWLLLFPCAHPHTFHMTKENRHFQKNLSPALVSLPKKQRGGS